jgi:hypothetical protein
MTSSSKVQTNRHNARHSTGPRTRGGKLRASRNARRHGLASVAEDVESVDVDRLAAALAPVCADIPAELIRAAAGVQLQLRHVRRVRASFGRELLDALDAKRNLPFLDRLARYERLDRYEQAVRARAKRTLRTILS